MNTELPGNTSSLVAYYTFNQGVPCSNNSNVDTVIDSTNALNHGNLVNFDLTGNLNDPCQSNWNGPANFGIAEPLEAE